MKNEHILDILDDKVFDELSRDERRELEIHTANCRSCLKAYEAAKMSSLLLKTSVTQNFEPSPFFQTRVLANLREKQARIKPLAAFARIWRASGALVVMMITTVFVLIGLTVFAPANVSATVDNDSAEIVILDERVPTKEPTNEQVFQLIYDTGDSAEK